VNQRNPEDILVEMARFLGIPARKGEVIEFLQLHGPSMSPDAVGSYHPARGTP